MNDCIMKQKYFIITVDTEGDNLWSYKQGDSIGTRNAEYLPRFQNLCEKYGFKPVYLTNYEMAMSDVFVKEAKQWLIRGTCEVGVHLHAWNNPPMYELNGPYSGNPYLIEYPENVMRAKFKVIYDLIVERFGIKPVSHRAGRWAMNETYFQILKDFEIKADCSYTPGVNWQRCKGTTIGGCDYSKKKRQVSNINGITEVPVSIIKNHKPLSGSLRHKVKTMLKGESILLRPASSTLEMMKAVIDEYANDETVDYVEFMLHSSEVMPEGSPYFKTIESVEQEYRTMESLFEYAKQNGYKGCTLKEYINK